MVKLSELGERRLIEVFVRALDKFGGMLLPYNDDVAAMEIRGVRLALSCDMLVWDTDVPRGMSYWQAGRKAVVSCISDMAAKGAKPLTILASLGLPPQLGLDEALELMRGLNSGAREYDAYIVGGDTNEASTVIVDVAALGLVEGNLTSRSGAKPGDILAVTGLFGKTAAALLMYERKLTPSSSKLRDSLWESLTMPKARLKEGLALASTGVATASIDSSDGLAASLFELSRASGVGFVVEEVPIAEEAQIFAEEFDLDPVDLALYGGEEFELLVTIARDSWSMAADAVDKAGGKLIRIGEAVADRKVQVYVEGSTRTVEPRGWEHLRLGASRDMV